MENLNKVKIVTERLNQVPIDKKYANDIFNHFNSEITTFMFPKPAEKISETLKFIEEAIVGIQNGTNLQMVIIDRETCEFLGCAGLHNTNSKTPELGVWLKKEAHGKGLGMEAMTAVIMWARKNLVFDYLIYPVDKRNHASRKIPEKNGGIIAREFTDIGMAGNELDEVEYHIFY